MSYFCDPFSFYDLFPNLHFDFTGTNWNDILTQPLAYTRDREDSPGHTESPLQETLSTDTSSDVSPTMYAPYLQRSLEVTHRHIVATQQTVNYCPPAQQQPPASAPNARSYASLSIAAGTGAENSTSGSSSKKRSGKEGNRYPCTQCGKHFTSSSNLAVHAMIHTGTKPFKCELCPWAFRQKAHLQKHMRHIHKMMVVK